MDEEFGDRTSEERESNDHKSFMKEYPFPECIKREA